MTSCDLTKSWEPEQLMTLETSPCRQKQDPTWLEMMVSTAGTFMAYRAVPCCHINRISPQRTPSRHEQKTTCKGVERVQISKNLTFCAMAWRTVFMGQSEQTALPSCCIHKTIWQRRESGNLCICVFFRLSSLSCSLPTRWYGHLSLTAKGQFFSLSGLALDTLWYKIKCCKFFSLFYVMQCQIEP
jgi:hypothetical protein